MSDAVRAVAIGATVLSYGIGGALSIAVIGALTEPMHAPIIHTLSRVWAWAVRALSVALRAFVVAWVWAVRYARRYGYRGNSRPVKRGQHRPNRVVGWQAAQAYNVRLPRSAMRSVVWGA